MQNNVWHHFIGWLKCHDIYYGSCMKNVAEMVAELVQLV